MTIALWLNNGSIDRGIDSSVANCDRSIMLFISGLQLEALAYELSGTLVRDISYPGAVFRDGRLRRGDLILFLNHECLWRVTSSQAKIVLRRADFVTNGIP